MGACLGRANYQYRDPHGEYHPNLATEPLDPELLRELVNREVRTHPHYIRDFGRSRRRPEERGRKHVKTQPLKKDVMKWKSELPITLGQLNSKRDEFWDTAPVFEGRKEIWDALKAASLAIESKDFGLAQAIIDGASIYIPTGSLTEAYDELGNQYKVPIYCLSKPLNLLCEDLSEESSSIPRTPPDEIDKQDHVLRIRLAPSARDYDLAVKMGDMVAHCKAKLGMKLGTAMRQRWFYGGKLLEDKTKVRDLKVPDGHVIQVVLIECQVDAEDNSPPST